MGHDCHRYRLHRYDEWKEAVNISYLAVVVAVEAWKQWGSMRVNVSLGQDDGTFQTWNDL
jgi:hypothetical protein